MEGLSFCLFSNVTSPELKELIHTMLQNAATVLKRTPQPLPTVPMPPAKPVSTPLPGMPPIQAPQVSKKSSATQLCVRKNLQNVVHFSA